MENLNKELKAKLAAAMKVAVEERFKDERRRLTSTVGKDIAELLTPFLKEIAQNAKTSKEDLRGVMQELMSSANAREFASVDTGEIIEAIHVAFGNVNMPQPRVTVNSPKIDIPKMTWPDGEMPIQGWVRLMGVDFNNPLPVQLRDGKGNPLNLLEGITQMIGGGATGGKGDYFTIKAFSQSAFSELTNPDGRVKVELPTGSSSLTDTELRASSVPVAQASGAIWSTAVIDIFGSTAASSVFNADNRIKVSVETGGSGLTDAELRATAVPVSQVSGASWSTEATQSGTWNIGTVTTVTGITNSVASALIDSGGVQYSGSNPLPISGAITVSGSVTSTVATGPTVADAVDDGSAPVQGGGIARTTNPTAVAGNDVVKSTHDDLGRQVMRPMQVRDLILTAYATVSNGTETTLRAAVAGAYLDLITLVGANNSDAAVSVDIRAVTAGGVVGNLQIPANGTAGFALPVPYPQQETGNNWTVDLPDITGTTISFTALFSQEV